MIGTHGRTSVNSKSSATPGLTVLLFGLIMCYQIVSHIYQWKTLSQEDFELGGDARHDDASCAVAAGPGGPSSLCMEAQLFKGWHESPEDLEQLLAISPGSQSEQKASVSPTSAPQSTSDSETDSKLRRSFAAADMRGEAKPQEPMRTSPPAQKSESPSMRGSVAPSNAPEETRTEPLDGFSKSLLDLQAQLEAKMRSQAQRHAEHRALRALHASHASVVSPEVAPATLPVVQPVPDTSDSKIDAWEKKVDALTHGLEDHMKARLKAREELLAKRFAMLNSLGKLQEPPQTATQPATPEEAHPLLDEIQSFQKRLCQDPERRSYPECAQFVHADAPPSTGHDSHKSHAAKHADAMAHIKVLEKHFEELSKEHHHDSEEMKRQGMEYLKDLCSDPARSSYPACARLVQAPQGTPLATAPPPTATKNQRSSRNEVCARSRVQDWT